MVIKVSKSTMSTRQRTQVDVSIIGTKKEITKEKKGFNIKSFLVYSWYVLFL